MTQDEIIRMAREAGFTDYYPERLTRFAALVAAHTKEDIKRTSITMLQDGEAAVLAEREACAKVCEEEITIDDEAFNDGVNACINSIKLRSK